MNPATSTSTEGGTRFPRRYRIVATRLDDTHPGPAAITTYVTALSIEEAARKAAEKTDTKQAEQYRVVRVEDRHIRAEESELTRLRALAAEFLATTYPHTMKRRRILEALGEADGLCNASTIEPSTGDPIRCTLEAGHYNPAQRPEGRDPGSWHLCNASRWNDAGGACRPHQPA